MKMKVKIRGQQWYIFSQIPLFLLRPRMFVILFLSCFLCANPDCSVRHPTDPWGTPSMILELLPVYIHTHIIVHILYTNTILLVSVPSSVARA